MQLIKHFNLTPQQGLIHLKKYPGISSASALERKFPKVSTVFVLENVCTSGI